jgi:para-nitrobenzyl esterase
MIELCRAPLRVALSVAAIVFALAAQANASYDKSLTQSVTTAKGTRSAILGQIDPENTGAQRFLGIPFAAPPVGPLRWRAPVDPPSWAGVRSAATFGNHCAQVSWFFDPSPNPAKFFTLSESEDCLYLNVFRPNTDQADLPVFYWIHGGTNIFGGADDPFYEAAKFAAINNVVVVTVNYRLGMLGFLYEPALDTASTSALDSSGNFATLDLLKGLDWVKSNIPTFGGNSANITVGGESAGCIDLWGLIQTPLAASKFQKAICMSGFPNTSSTTAGQDAARQLEVSLLVKRGMTEEQAQAARLNMSSSAVAALLRSASAAEIVRMSGNPSHFLDGTVLPSYLGTPGVLKCRHNAVPMIVGSVNSEGTLFLAGAAWISDTRRLWNKMNASSSTSTYADVLNLTWLPALHQSFPSSNYAKTSRTLSELIVYATDEVDRYLQSQILCLPPPVYRYQFQWANEPQPWQNIFGSEHGMDVPFVFGNFSKPSFLGHAFTAANQPDRLDLSKLMNSYFANFLWNGDPNKPSGNPNPYAGAPTWNAWTNAPTRHKRLMLNASPGRADAGIATYMSGDEELDALRDVLSLPTIGYTPVNSFLQGIISQEWLTMGFGAPEGRERLSAGNGL